MISEIYKEVVYLLEEYLNENSSDNIETQYQLLYDAIDEIKKRNVPDNYQMLALKTWHNKDVAETEQINHAMLQLAAECGEVVKLWAKHLYKPAHEITREKVLDELGDLWYYVRIVAYLHDITIDELTEYNHQKLVGGHGWNGSDEKIKSRMDGAK